MSAMPLSMPVAGARRPSTRSRSRRPAASALLSVGVLHGRGSSAPSASSSSLHPAFRSLVDVGLVSPASCPLPASWWKRSLNQLCSPSASCLSASQCMRFFAGRGPPMCVGERRSMAPASPGLPHPRRPPFCCCPSCWCPSRCPEPPSARAAAPSGVPGMLASVAALLGGLASTSMGLDAIVSASSARATPGSACGPPPATPTTAGTARHTAPLFSFPAAFPAGSRRARLF
mmetsp:Transcript_11846/g.49896  ORF Transcript_11846/g.49896 Transcript_11846/m.49896 type:complete len:231 (+) Transcript_11846:1044-1736(+)